MQKCDLRTSKQALLCIRATATIKFSLRRNEISRLWLITALSSFGVSFTFNSVFNPMSILYQAIMSWYLTRSSSTACFSASVSNVIVQWIVWRICFENLRHFLGFFSFSLSVHSTRWGLVSVLWYHHQFCQDFQVSDTRRCYCAVLVHLFWVVRLDKWSDLDHLSESYWGLPCYPALWTWIAPESIRRTRQNSSFLNQVIPLK